MVILKRNTSTESVYIIFTLQQLETHGCILIIMATDTMMLKHQALSIYSADEIFIVLDQFQTNF